MVDRIVDQGWSVPVTSGVQSLARAFALLEALAASPDPMGVAALAEGVGLPVPTVHRMLRTLVDLGYARQDPTRRYGLGPRVALLAEGTGAMLGALARPHLTALVDELGETANLASLDGDRVVYVAQVPSRHSMRMFTEVGRAVLPHATAVGKAVLAGHPPTEVLTLLTRTGMPGHTEHTLTDPTEFAVHLEQVRRQGWAVDDGEQELGVRCVAVAIPSGPAPALPRLAVSVSGPTARMTTDLIDRAVPALRAAAVTLAADLAGPGR
ncbi:IclR family transcriptional regulator [Nakamurella leprariae]|uniref:IclR family transcriptional regulator n=1 Tax=Nakamurella leprariae TaxID=2803911 RepID=UPI002E2DFA55|nr:IclR family transcriptional regulator [Nakamurella leprariae]